MVREADASAAARREIEQLQGALSGVEIDDTLLLTSELVNNAVLHAGPEAGRLFTLDVFVTDAVVRVAVTDGGAGFAPSPRPEEPTEGHWGLQLVDELADRWAVDNDHGTAVWFEIDRAVPAAVG
jgi:anti-sigma regulatory factor (Ser/Thr protein kinase)